MSAAPIEGNDLAASYALIYAFLLKHSHDKLAKRLKKAVQDTITIPDEPETASLSLDDILREWKTLKDASLKAKPSCSASSSSEDSSSSDSDSKSKPDSDSDSSDSDSSEASSSRSSASESSTPAKTAKKRKASIKKASNATAEPIPKTKTDKKNKPSVEVASTTLESSSSSGSDDEKPTKKRRTNEAGDAVTTATPEASTPMLTDTETKEKATIGKQPRKSNTPFRRINIEKVEASSPVIQDNRYEVKAAPVNDYGKKAHEDLIVTRGAGFRKEKNKKKRGSYRGGEITMQSHSFRFDD